MPTPGRGTMRCNAWAAVGLVWIAISVNTMYAWVTSERDFGPTEIMPGVTMPTSSLVALRVVEAASVAVLVPAIWVLAVKLWRRTREIRIEGLLVIGGIFGFVMDSWPLAQLSLRRRGPGAGVEHLHRAVPGLCGDCDGSAERFVDAATTLHGRWRSAVAGVRADSSLHRAVDLVVENPVISARFLAGSLEVSAVSAHKAHQATGDGRDRQAYLGQAPQVGALPGRRHLGAARVRI